MNSLVVALCLAILARECVSIPMSRSTYRDSGYHEKSTVTAHGIPNAGCETDISKQLWTPVPYMGPTAVPILREDGTIAETPEVAAARAAHFAALEFIRATNPDMDNGQYDPRKYGDNLYDNSPSTANIAKGVLVYSSHPMGYYASHPATGTNQQLEANVFGTGHSQAKASANAEAALAMWKSRNPVALGYPYNMPAVQNKPYFMNNIEVNTAEVAYSQGNAATSLPQDTWGTNNAVTNRNYYNTPLVQTRPYTSGATIAKATAAVYSQDQRSAAPGIATWKINDAGSVAVSYNPPVIQSKPYTSSSTTADAGEGVYSQGQSSATPGITNIDSTTKGYSYNPPLIEAKLYTSGTTAVNTDKVVFSQGQASATAGITTNDAATAGYSDNTSSVQSKHYSTTSSAGEVGYSQGHTSADSSSAIWRSNNGAAGYTFTGPISQKKPYVSNSIGVDTDELGYSQAKASADAALAEWNAKNLAPVVYTYGSPTAQNKPYVGPLAMIQLLSNGHLADTPEVAATKKLHLNAVAEARAASALWKAKHPQTHHKDVWN